MGIHGIYKEIGSGQRIALSKFAVETFERTGRPLRLAIDTSIWLFQIQSGKGGSNPALRTFYYRLLRLMALAIHPLFIFDGPNKPPFKRNKRTGPNVASIPEFLAKQLLKQFGFPFLIAPGEAEAECALLQREDVVDAVLSEDVDTLMFGSRLTLRNWSPEQSSSKVPTHVNIYDAEKTKSGSSGLDREGMVLVALLSGGDYVPQGVPGCGPKLACEAARAGFGKELCAIRRNDTAALGLWREKLTHELKTNESKFFRTKHASLNIPEDFPNPEVLGYYTHPAISSKDKVAKIKQTVTWDQPMNFPELRSFTGDAFGWVKLGGAKKFIRNLAPSVLVKELRLRARSSGQHNDDIEEVGKQEAGLVKAIHGKRNHVSTDGITELRVSFRPLDLVDIDLSVEEPDDEVEQAPSDVGDEEQPPPSTMQPPGSPSKFRGPLHYSPDEVEKLWISETYLKVGVPLKVQDWEESSRDARKHLAQKHAARAATQASRGGRKKGRGDVQQNSLNRFTKVTKPSQAAIPSTSKDFEPEVLDLSQLPSAVPTNPLLRLHASIMETQRVIDTRSPPPCTFQPVEELDLSRMDTELPELPSTITKRRRRSPLRRAQTDSVLPSPHSGTVRPLTPSRSPVLEIPVQRSLPPSPSPAQQAKRTRRAADPPIQNGSNPSTPRRNARQREVIDLLSSSPTRQSSITHFFSPSRAACAQTLDLSQLPRQPSPSREPPRHRNRSRSRSQSPTRSLQRRPETEKQQKQQQPISRPLTESIDLTTPPPPQRPITTTNPRTPAARVLKETLRIRDSLPGAFAIEVLDMTGESDVHRGPMQKAMGGRKGRTLRMSTLETLDLTGL